MQHIQQPFAVAGLVAVELVAPHVGEHAGYRDRRRRAAGAHVVEGDDPRLLTGEGVGLLVIAVHGEVLAARRLPTTRNIMVGFSLPATRLASSPIRWNGTGSAR